jgi:hypothetical protein
MEVYYSRSIENETVFLKAVRDCSEECISFVCEFFGKAGNETAVYLSKIAAFKCARLADTLEGGISIPERQLTSMIIACDIACREFINKQNPALNRYIAALKECIAESHHYLANHHSLPHSHMSGDHTGRQATG